LQSTHWGVAITRPVFQRAGRGNEITGKMKGFATFFSGTGKGRSLLRYGFLGRLYRRVGWTDADKHGRTRTEWYDIVQDPPVLRASGDCTGPLGAIAPARSGGLHWPARGDCTGPLGGIPLACAGSPVVG